MGLLRRRDAGDPERDESPRHGVYRVEVDNERRHFHQEVPFSFWASAKVIFLLSVLLWWLPQSAGYMVAGYVGGRRAGAPWKAVVAALIPVILIFGVNASYGAGYGRSQIDFLSGLPTSIATAVGSAIPFLEPYSKFVVSYLATFIEALQRLFGMGSNGYMVTIAFAYIGGIVADQTRREIGSKSGSATSVNIVQPIFQRLHHADREYADREDRDEVVAPARAAWTRWTCVVPVGVPQGPCAGHLLPPCGAPAAEASTPRGRGGARARADPGAGAPRPPSPGILPGDAAVRGARAPELRSTPAHPPPARLATFLFLRSVRDFARCFARSAAR